MAGVKTKLMSATRGLAVMTTTFAGYRPYAGEFDKRERGNLLCHEAGTATSHGIMKAQERGALFSCPGDEVYENQIVGMHARAGDLKVNICRTYIHFSWSIIYVYMYIIFMYIYVYIQVNICRTKQLTNMRSAGKDDNVNVVPAQELTLEEAVEYIEDDEFVEVTPEAVRMGRAGKK